MKIVGVTACTAGIAHTYIVAEKIADALHKFPVNDLSPHGKPSHHILGYLRGSQWRKRQPLDHVPEKFPPAEDVRHGIDPGTEKHE